MLPKVLNRVANRLLGRRLQVAIRKRLSLKRLISGRHSTERELGILDHLIPEGGKCLDIGANLGYYTVRLQSLVGTAGTVFAFEPIYEARECLAYAKHLLEWDNVHVFGYALSNVNGECDMTVPMDDHDRLITGLSHISSPGEEGYLRCFSAEVRRLDDLDLDLEGLAFVKCDVEGTELRVLEGAQNTLKMFQPILLVEIEQRHVARYHTTTDKVFGNLHALRYKSYYFDGKLLVQCMGCIDGFNNYIFIPKNRTAVTNAFNK